MEGNIVEQIYETLMGFTAKGYQYPGVENAFAVGKDCDSLYTQVYEAYDRICRNNLDQENEDVECIMDNLMEICRIIGFKMFGYGMKFANHKITPEE